MIFRKICNDTSTMSATELAHNFVFVKNREAWYRDFDREIPYAVGVYCPDGAELRSVKKAKRKDRERPVSEMLLMMFRSAARERRRGD